MNTAIYKLSQGQRLYYNQPKKLPVYDKQHTTPRIQRATLFTQEELSENSAKMGEWMRENIR